MQADEADTRTTAVVLGSVVTEMAALSIVYTVAGSALVACGVAGRVGPALLGGSLGIVFLVGVMVTRWRLLVRTSLDHVRLLSEGCDVEDATRTVGRVVFRVAAPTAVLAVLVATSLSSLGEGVVGGLLLAGGLCAASCGVWLRRWQDTHRRLLLRETRRWVWIDQRDDPLGGRLEWSVRLRTAKEGVRERGWAWYMVGMDDRTG